MPVSTVDTHAFQRRREVVNTPGPNVVRAKKPPRPNTAKQLMAGLEPAVKVLSKLHATATNLGREVNPADLEKLGSRMVKVPFDLARKKADIVKRHAERAARKIDIKTHDNERLKIDAYNQKIKGAIGHCSARIVELRKNGGLDNKSLFFIALYDSMILLLKDMKKSTCQNHRHDF